MAGRTLTATPWTTNPKVNIQSADVSWDFNTGATKLGTASDVVLLAKIPDQVEILDYLLKGVTKSDTQQILRVEVQDTGGTALAIIVPTFTVSSTGGQVYQRPSLGSAIPYKVSLSSDHALGYARLALVFLSGTETVSASLAGWIRYSANSKTPP